jgi:hypothetical protein
VAARRSIRTAANGPPGGGAAQHSHRRKRSAGWWRGAAFAPPQTVRQSTPSVTTAALVFHDDSRLELQRDSETWRAERGRSMRRRCSVSSTVPRQSRWM